MLSWFMYKTHLIVFLVRPLWTFSVRVCFHKQTLITVEQMVVTDQKIPLKKVCAVVLLRYFQHLLISFPCLLINLSASATSGGLNGLIGSQTTQ